MTKVTAQLNNLRIAPRKVRLVADRVRGQQVNEAIGMLKYDLRKTAEPMVKLLKSAVANAENNFKVKGDDLYIADITVGEGPTLKRWTPRAYGRATKILKRTSRVKIILSEMQVKENEIKKVQKSTTKAEVIKNSNSQKDDSK